MKCFAHVNAKDIDDAAAILRSGKARAIAGGTDLLGALKDKILPEYPETVVNLKTIEGLDSIVESSEGLKIGALTKLKDIADSSLIKEKYKSLAEAAYSVASPLIRNQATIGGNICQDVRCWYYRYPHQIGGRLECMRKGGERCFAPLGDNRYHSVFGGMKVSITPCSKECPANTDIPGYMEKLREGDWDAAAKIIMRVNPMPMVTSRICPHVCENKCNQNCNGESVSIHNVENALGNYILENKDKFYAKPDKETGKKIGIIGAGPSGLTCAFYMRTHGHDVTVIDAHEKAGGILRYGIPHYRLPKSIVDDLVSALEGMGVNFELNTLVGEDIQMEDIQKRFDAIYFGTGAWKQPILGIQGEELTQFGLNFLAEVNTYLKKAASFGDNVLVCGGGNVAMDVALTAVRLGAKNVTLACLEQEDEMPASSEEVARAKEEGVKIYNGRGLKRVITDNKGNVAGLETMKCISVFNEEGRFDPKYDQSDLMTINSDCIILATGQRVDVSFLGEKFSAQLKSQRGLIDVEDTENYKTKLPSVYAGGDVVTGPNICISAIRAGGRAARSMSRELGFPITSDVESRGFIQFDSEGIKMTDAITLRERPLGTRTLVDEDAESPTVDEALAEARRCMNCGCLVVNSSDIATVLVSLGAKIKTNKKLYSAEEFFTSTAKITDLLDQDELVTEIVISPQPAGSKMAYDKFRVRESIDFSIVSVASTYEVESGRIKSARVVLGAVAPVPIRTVEVEDFLKGKEISEKVAEKAADLAVVGANVLDKNEYKIQIAKTLVKRSILNAQ
jgi:NADPH-dependent glutamate synthase beta subunit-like oxidoreductase/CO/xanthine dehydrogenase FAD-binding subunit